MYRLLPLVASFAAKDFGAIINRARRNAVLYVIAAVFFVTAYVAALVGGGLYLAMSMGAMEAAFAIAVGMLLFAVTTVSGVLMLNKLERRRERARNGTRALAATAALSLVPRVLNSKALVSVAVLGGLAMLATRGSNERDE